MNKHTILAASIVRVIERELSAFDEVLSLTDRLGPAVSACAPAFAVAALAAERQP